MGRWSRAINITSTARTGFRGRDGRIEQLPVHGVPLGLFADTGCATEAIDVSPGDVVVVCSDGLTEAENRREEAFEAERLHAVLRRLVPAGAQEIADGLTGAALEFAGGREAQRDDYTVVVLKFG